MLQKCIIFFAFLILATAEDLSCYNCRPEDAGQCKNPSKNNIKATKCSPSDLPIEGSSNDTYSCYSVYFTPDASTKNVTEGYYRGCTSREKGCDTVREKIGSKGVVGTVTDCKLCNENECNKNAGRIPKTNFASFFIFPFLVYCSFQLIIYS